MDVTIDLNTIPEESSLVDQGLKSQLAGIFGRMEKRVSIISASIFGFRNAICWQGDNQGSGGFIRGKGPGDGLLSQGNCLCKP